MSETTKEKSKNKGTALKTEVAPSKSFYAGTGRRKTAVARVRLTLGKGDILVNDKPINEVFTDAISRKVINEPFEVVSRVGGFGGTIKLAGGGIKAQAVAISHGVSRALVAYDEQLRPQLSRAKLLTRDPRMKESRKYGLSGKARRGKQSPKR